MTALMGGQPCGRSALGIGSGGGRLDPNVARRHHLAPAQGAGRRDATRARRARGGPRTRAPGSARARTDRAAGRLRQLPEVLEVPVAADVVRPLLDELDDVV